MFSERTQLLAWQPDIPLTGHRFDLGDLSRLAYPALKRLMDILFSLTLIVLLAPLMAAIAIAIKLDSQGPVLYVHRRCGLHGRVFNFYKFRSLTNGHDHTQEHREFAEAYINGHSTTGQEVKNGNPIFKPTTNHGAVTRVGRWLRRTSLDELPQLFNVLVGDMSLVGPRPSIDYEVGMYSDRHRQRLTVLPGITGWAQINGRSSLTFDEIVTLDLEYILQRSLWRDISILLATLPVVIQADGAG